MSSEPFVVRGLGRASTESQAMSPKQQEDVCLQGFSLYKRVKPGWENAQWGGFYFDEATSRTSRILEREVASLVIAATKRNDVIMAAKYDRIFANVLDVCEVIELIEAKSIRLCILDFDFDLSSHIGKAFFKMMAIIKELEVNEIRQRARDSAAYRRKHGLPNNGQPPIGWRSIEGADGYRTYTEDEGHRRLAKRLIALREREEYRHCNLDLFTTAVNNLGLTHPSGRQWTRPALSRWMDAARKGFPKCAHDLDFLAESVPLPPVGGNHTLA